MDEAMFTFYEAIQRNIAQVAKQSKIVRLKTEYQHRKGIAERKMRLKKKSGKVFFLLTALPLCGVKSSNRDRPGFQKWAVLLLLDKRYPNHRRPELGTAVA
ncbi:hypothetical protein AVEN_138446-1 [Araneus ventricosus]|uniref:Uncharacterized protein n=1 Tax=Araneus ventricosus TaxID=182803 RepID=A0A4Y2CG68_ARAVE|nr:hypothetical protein AVEN_138446-1 [Araneus ventricosus]